jgi:hypothetical protein
MAAMTIGPGATPYGQPPGKDWPRKKCPRCGRPAVTLNGKKYTCPKMHEFSGKDAEDIPGG